MIQEPFIAVVSQPACANVFHVTENGKKIRLCQDTREYCAAFAAGYLRALPMGYCRKYRCPAGDASRYVWELESDE